MIKYKLSLNYYDLRIFQVISFVLLFLALVSVRD